MRLLKKVKHKIRFGNLLNNKSKIDKDVALNKIFTFYPERLEAPKFIQESTVQPQVDLMVIVPVYNSADFLSECIGSILNQRTKYTYTIYFVNDGSTDASGEILIKYKDYHNVKIIDQINQGASSARNIALKTIVGRYVMFVDSDDVLAEDAVEKLMNTAYSQKADIVEGNFVGFNLEKNNIGSCHLDETQNVSSSTLYGYAWGKVISAEIMKNICFPVGFLYEDTIMSTIVHPLCEKICTISDVVYYYRINQQGLDTTSAKKRQAIDSFWLTKYCLEESLKRRIMLTPERQKQYYDQFRINWMRLALWPEEIRESVFVMCCDLSEKYFLKGEIFEKNSKYSWMQKTIENTSYDAFQYLLLHWDELN